MEQLVNGGAGSHVDEPRARVASAERSALAVDLVMAGWGIESAEYEAHILDLAGALTRHQGHRVALRIRRTSTGLPGSEHTRGGFRLVRMPAGPPITLSRARLLPHLDEFASVLDREWTDRPPDVAHPHSWTTPSGARSARSRARARCSWERVATEVVSAYRKTSGSVPDDAVAKRT